MSARFGATKSLTKGDERRTALLGALEELLREVGSVEAINVAEVSRRAGVTRSAFYFYFENKAIAVAALTETIYQEAAASGVVLTDLSRPPAERIAEAVGNLFDVTERHEHVYRALLEARATNPEIRAMWEADRESFQDVVADMIRTERAAGRAPDGVDASGLASVLLDLNDRNMERRVVEPIPERQTHIDVVTSIWVRSIYGT